MKAFLIDLTKCVGCHDCQIGCKDEHCDQAWLPYAEAEPEVGQFWLKLKQFERGAGSHVRVTYMPTLCNHCAEPACVANCPTGAMAKREDNGAVVVDQDVCIGCGTCVNSCPYEVPQLDEAAGVSSKCTLCYQRLAYDKLPWCVESCPANARFVGDINDPSSEVAKLIAEKNAKPLMEEFGTGPSVYYI